MVDYDLLSTKQHFSLTSSSLHDMGDSFEQAQHRQKLGLMRAELKALLKQPLVNIHSSGKYPTKSGRLVVPFFTGERSFDFYNLNT